MLKVLLLSAAYMTHPSPTPAQGNIQIVARDTTGFILYLNNIPQNSSPQKSVTLSGLKKGTHEVIVRLNDSAASRIEKSLMVRDGKERTFELDPLPDQGFNLNLVAEIEADPTRLDTTNDTIATDTAKTDTTPAYKGPRGCSDPISANKFAGILEDLREKNFEKKKIRAAKKMIRSKCLWAEQVQGIIKLFEYEDHKLDFSKYAYEMVYDRANYLEIKKELDFKSSREELEHFVREQ